MIEIRKFDKLGHANHGWLDTRHHFSFADYHDPKRMGWGPLRVWNDDEIRGGSGFPPHSHRDMEIITYVRKGAISHEDHLGHKGRTEAGDIQVMSAGTGIVHAEYNRETGATDIFQIWVQPNVQGGQPRWENRTFPQEARHGRLVAVASGRPSDSEAAALLAGTVQPGEEVVHDLAPGRSAYLVAARGTFEINGQTVNARDGVAVRDEAQLRIRAVQETEVLLMDLPSA
jgi:redox-sensitive bicupin YhaK (pirin superfamily)